MEVTKLLNYLKSLSKKKKIYLTLALGCVIFVGLFLLKTTGAQNTKAESIPLVRTTVVGSKEGVDSYSYPGEVHARYEKQLAFQVSGKVIKKNVQPGSNVNAGDVLLEMDPKDIAQIVNSSLAQVNSATSQLRLAESNLDRYRQLYEQNAVSRAQLDQYENSYEVARSAVQQARALYEQSSNQLDYSKLHADSDGVIASVSVEAGQVVSAGQPVVILVQNGEREVEISVPENRIEEIRNASKIIVNFWALPDILVDGKVREISPIAASTTRTYKVRISLINPPSNIGLGMTANVSLAGGDEKDISTMTIPSTAIYQTGDNPCVWVVVDNVTNLRKVKIIKAGNDFVKVTGLKKGEIIVTAGVNKIREHQKVRLAEGA
ncbi:MAG: efflux RND transporter periplasmic adaptor subunit [Acholeplasmataceae bacterium]|nr:efflux RND transporter periplasmic adaptor subunit [Acholeplasmataceae bacterium]